MTKEKTLEVIKAMLVECRAHPESGTRNWKVADLIGHYLELLGEHDRVLTIIRDHDHEELRRKIDDA